MAGRPLGRLRQSQSVKAACALGMAAGGPTAAGGAGALSDSSGGSRSLRCGRTTLAGAAADGPAMIEQQRMTIGCGVGEWRSLGRFAALGVAAAEPEQRRITAVNMSMPGGDDLRRRGATAAVWAAGGHRGGGDHTHTQVDERERLRQWVDYLRDSLLNSCQILSAVSCSVPDLPPFFLCQSFFWLEKRNNA